MSGNLRVSPVLRPRVWRIRIAVPFQSWPVRPPVASYCRTCSSPNRLKSGMSRAWHFGRRTTTSRGSRLRRRVLHRPDVELEPVLAPQHRDGCALAVRPLREQALEAPGLEGRAAREGEDAVAGTQPGRLGGAPCRNGHD